MVNATNALRADLVLLTGDLINYELADLSEGIALVKAMEGRYGLWTIEGNHDLAVDGGEFERRVKAAGVPLLLDESAVANVRGYPVQFFGLRWMDGGAGQRDRVTALQVREVLKQRQPDAFPILLAHHPHAFDAAVKADLPLTLAGHTHGGQFMLDSQWLTRSLRVRSRVRVSAARARAGAMVRVYSSRNRVEAGGGQRLFLASDALHFGYPGVGIEVGCGEKLVAGLFDGVFQSQPVAPRRCERSFFSNV
jgi:predicted MPP superfamily phosphohydrolase